MVWAAQGVEKWSKTFFGAPPARTCEFFFAPGGLQERSGFDFSAKEVPRWSPGASGRSFGSFSEQYWLHVGIVFNHFGSCSHSRFGTSGGGAKQQREQQAQRRKQQKQQQNSSSESSRSSSETSRSMFGHFLNPHPHSFMSLSLPACPATPATMAPQILRVGGCPR